MAAHIGVVLKDGGREKSSRWVELWAGHLLTYFVWEEKQTKVRIDIDSSWAQSVVGPVS